MISATVPGTGNPSLIVLQSSSAISEIPKIARRALSDLCGIMTKKSNVNHAAAMKAPTAIPRSRNRKPDDRDARGDKSIMAALFEKYFGNGPPIVA
jgi:hypothetical protein